MCPWNKQAVLDLGPMKEAFGSIDDAAKTTFGLFLTSTGPLLLSIRTKLLAGDLPGAAAAAHSAKGTSNVTGAFRLGALCDAVYTQLRHGDVETAQSLTASLMDAFEAVRGEIDKRIAGLDDPLA